VVVMDVDAGKANMNAEVPCSVTAGEAGTSGDMVVAPNMTLLNVAPGPNPVAFTVTSVPAGPEVGESVTVGVFRVKTAVPVLPWASVSVSNVPDVIAGRLTVPVYAPVKAFATVVSVLLLSDSGEVTN